ncbi:MAG: fructosamine kinase family protein [Cyclobacteriaceae bacterium]
MNIDQTEQFLRAVLLRTTGKENPVKSFKSISGGCINNGLKVTVEDLPGKEVCYFVKWNDESVGTLFEKESLGLDLLRTQTSFSIPSVIGYGVYGIKRFLVLEWIESAVPGSNFWEEFGRKLADQHRSTAEQYGLSTSNYIGKLTQINEYKDNWIDFFIENRLEVQLGLAIYNRRISKEFAKRFRYLYSQLPGLLVEEPASLLHGDLWSGNFIADADGNPCLIDPAVYYGNREIEIAFTKLFGGFDQQFYRTYEEVYPLQAEFDVRADIYNLYPLLVHVNIFGDSYLPGIEMVMRQYC